MIERIITLTGEKNRYGIKKNNKNLPNSHDLNRMFLELGDDSALAQIRRYVRFHLNHLAPNIDKLNLDTSSKNNLYNSIADIEPDVFFNTYYPDYFAFTDPFSHRLRKTIFSIGNNIEMC